MSKRILEVVIVVYLPKVHVPTCRYPLCCRSKGPSPIALALLLMGALGICHWRQGWSADGLLRPSKRSDADRLGKFSPRHLVLHSQESFYDVLRFDYPIRKASVAILQQCPNRIAVDAVIVVISLTTTQQWNLARIFSRAATPSTPALRR